MGCIQSRAIASGKTLEGMSQEERETEQRKKELVKMYQGAQLNHQIHNKSKGVAHSKGLAM